VKWPTKKQLGFLLCHLTITQVSKRYDVDVSSVKYWCEKYGLHTPTRRERRMLQKLKKGELREKIGIPLIFV
jgi:hypothetical protein